MMVSKVRGRFGGFTGTVTTTEDGLGSSVDATVDMASVDTGDANRDQHLRTSDFFDVEHHPTMTFRSTGLVGGGEEYELTGDLTIRGITRPVSFDLEVGGVTTDPWGAERAGFTATASMLTAGRRRARWGNLLKCPDAPSTCPPHARPGSGDGRPRSYAR
jgi:polyisoprenoid-binding protein YceI